MLRQTDRERESSGGKQSYKEEHMRERERAIERISERRTKRARGMAITKRNAKTSKAGLTVYKTVRARDRHNDNVSVCIEFQGETLPSALPK